jgi:hypothetical protein
VDNLPLALINSENSPPAEITGSFVTSNGLCEHTEPAAVLQNGPQGSALSVSTSGHSVSGRVLIVMMMYLCCYVIKPVFKGISEVYVIPGRITDSVLVCGSINTQ